MSTNLGAPRATEERAVDACAAYEHWASEVRRLTVAIAAIQCPTEGYLFSAESDEGTPSCFRAAATERIPGQWGDGDSTRRTLEEIAVAVADCPACSALTELIRARRYARKRFGVAKRAVRFAGKRALTTGAQP